eukprot:3260585-Rhodomonas_salina.6
MLRGTGIAYSATNIRCNRTMVMLSAYARATQCPCFLLRASYAMPGTDLAYGARARTGCSIP